MMPGEVFLLVVIAVMTFHIVTLHRRLARIEKTGVLAALAPTPAPANAEEFSQLKQRINVLERIATEKESSVSREIDQLRDR